MSNRQHRRNERGKPGDQAFERVLLERLVSASGGREGGGEDSGGERVGKTIEPHY